MTSYGTREIEPLRRFCRHEALAHILFNGLGWPLGGRDVASSGRASTKVPFHKALAILKSIHVNVVWLLAVQKSRSLSPGLLSPTARSSFFLE